MRSYLMQNQLVYQIKKIQSQQSLYKVNQHINIIQESNVNWDIKISAKKYKFHSQIVKMNLVDWIVKQTAKITDNFNNYKFYIKQQPEIIDSSTIVSIHTYNSRDMTATIPCSFKWSTIRNNLTTEIQHFKGNTYICEPADVGCFLQVQITSLDPQCTGTAIMTYGPVKFDVLLKKQIEIALSKGDSSFLVDIGEGETQRQCQFKVTEEKITISQINSQASLTFNYGMFEPKIQVLNKMPSKIKIFFSPKYYQELQKFVTRISCRQVQIQEINKNPFIEINFNSRKAKDCLIYTIKAFNTKKQLKSTSYVSILQKQLDFTKLSQNSKTFDYIEMISQFQNDINKLLTINSKCFVEKKLYIDENKKLEKEIQDIITTYVKIIEEKFSGLEDFQKSFILLKEKEDEIKNQKGERTLVLELQAKITLLQQENKSLKDILSKNTHLNIKNNNPDQSLSPFKKKSAQNNMLFEGAKTENQFENRQLLQIQKASHKAKEELKIMTLKYENLLKEFEHINNKKRKVSVDTGNLAREREQFNFDLYDAKSVRSVRDKNHVQCQDFESLLLSKDSTLINPDRMKFIAPSQPIKFSTTQPQNPSYSELQQQNQQLKQQLSLKQQKLISLQTQIQQKQQKYKKRINDLTQQLQMYKRNNDVLNRSQHLSIEMDDYNREQMEIIKRDNQFLRSQVQTYKDLCQKYMTDAKKYKKIVSQNHDKLTTLVQGAL